MQNTKTNVVDIELVVYLFTDLLFKVQSFPYTLVTAVDIDTESERNELFFFRVDASLSHFMVKYCPQKSVHFGWITHYLKKYFRIIPKQTK